MVALVSLRFLYSFLYREHNHIQVFTYTHGNNTRKLPVSLPLTSKNINFLFIFYRGEMAEKGGRKVKKV
jgi:hypothetical protein